LQEKGSLAIDPEGSQDPTHSEERCNPDSILSQYKRQVEESTRHLSEGDLEEEQALIPEDKAPSLIKFNLIRFEGTHEKLMTIVEIVFFIKYYT
jgi:hypothetical protein